jgi:hypothetical protein
MMMPPTPTPHFVITPAEILFAVLKAGLDGPPHPAQPDQGRQRGMGGRVAQIGLQLPSQEVASQDQPDLGAGQPLSHRDDPHRRKAGDQGPLASLLDRPPPPAVRGQRRGQLRHLFGRGFPCQHPGTRRFPALARPSRHCRGGPLPPDRRVVRHLRKANRVTTLWVFVTFGECQLMA